MDVNIHDVTKIELSEPKDYGMYTARHLIIEYRKYFDDEKRPERFEATLFADSLVSLLTDLDEQKFEREHEKDATVRAVVWKRSDGRYQVDFTCKCNGHASVTVTA